MKSRIVLPALLVAGLFVLATPRMRKPLCLGGGCCEPSCCAAGPVVRLLRLPAQLLCAGPQLLQLVLPSALLPQALLPPAPLPSQPLLQAAAAASRPVPLRAALPRAAVLPAPSCCAAPSCCNAAAVAAATALLPPAPLPPQRCCQSAAAPRAVRSGCCPSCPPRCGG